MQDQGSIIRSGMAIVPDYAQQAAQAQQLALQRQQAQMQQQEFALKQQAAQSEQQEQIDFKTALEGYQRSGNPQDLVKMMAHFPKHSEGLKRAWEAQDQTKRDGDLRHATELYGYARSGRYDKAAESLEMRIKAEREAGEQIDPADEQMLADLKSGDPEAQRSAMSQIGLLVAVATGPDKFSATYGELNPEAKLSPFMREYQDRVAQFGQQAADAWAAVNDQKLIAVNPGGTVYNAADFTGGSASPPVAPNAQPTGGAATGGAVKNGRSVIESLFPNVRVTDNVRDPNSKLGKANPNSWHVKSGGAVDIAPIPGMTFQDFLKQIRSSGYSIIEAKDEVKNPSKHATGPHWHVVIGQGPGRQKPTSKKVGGKEYYQIGGKWYDNPEGK